VKSSFLRGIAALAVVTLSVALTSGCSPQPSDLSESAAFELQGAVDSVVAAVKDNRITAALASLNTVQMQLLQFTAAGDVGNERVATIQRAIDLVKADLAAAISQPSNAPRNG
jgi:hypothetical protein